jgi:hypothetical protein
VAKQHLLVPVERLQEIRLAWHDEVTGHSMSAGANA